MKSAIASADRVSAPQKFAFSAGYCVDYLAAGMTTSVLWMPFFNIGLGISPAVLGTVLMILRACDAFVDPVLGNISDNTRTRWGRRRPYIFVGAILTSLVYLALWRLPAGMDSTTALWLLSGVGCLYFTVYSVWGVSFYSLQMELTPSYDERTRVAAWVAVAGKLVYFAGGWVLAIASSKWFANSVTMKADVADYDEVHTSRRREGSLNAVYSWFAKVGAVAGAGLGGWALQLSGFDVKNAAQSPEIIERLKMVFVFLPLAFWGLAVVLIVFYNLSRSRMAAIRVRLEEIRGKI